MSKIRKAVIILFVSVLLVFVISFSMYSIDSLRIRKNTNPLFTFYTAYLNDGGSKIYYGLFYQIIKWKPIDGQEKIETHYIINFKDPFR